MNRPKSLLCALLVSALAIGCVSQGSYDGVVAEKDGLAQELASTRQDLTRTTAELERNSDTLKNTSANLTLMTGERDLLTSQLEQANSELNQTTQTLSTRTMERNTLQSNLESATAELNGMKKVLNDALDDLDHAQQNNLTLTGQLASRTSALATATESSTEARALYDSLQTETGISTKYKKVAERYLSGLRQTMAFVTNQISGSQLLDVVTPVTAAVAVTEDQGLIDAWQEWLDAPLGTATTLAEIEFVDMLMQRLRDNGPNPS